MKKIFIASDHAGYKLKSSITTKLKKIIDLGPKSNDAVDYPDYAKKLSKKVASNKGSFGILICGSGMGMAIAANKTKNIRAALTFFLLLAVIAIPIPDPHIRIPKLPLLETTLLDSFFA